MSAFVIPFNKKEEDEEEKAGFLYPRIHEGQVR